MAISKFLHMYNPALFPIFDGAVVQQSVLKVFGGEWRIFPDPILPRTVPVEMLNYLKYIFWASKLLQGKGEVVAHAFAPWLTAQLACEGAHEEAPPDCRHWYATAFEFIAIGATELQPNNSPSGGRPMRFARGTDFPHEGFVQQTIERYFTANGFTIVTKSTTDLICTHPDREERWEIEAKGLTTAIGLDFRTGLGQLIQRMTDQTTLHALAVPDLPQFRAQCRQVQPWVRQANNIFWLLVQIDGTVLVISPEEDV